MPFRVLGSRPQQVITSSENLRAFWNFFNDFQRIWSNYIQNNLCQMRQISTSFGNFFGEIFSFFG